MTSEPSINAPSSEPPAWKRCTACGLDKAIDSFHIDRAQPDGRKYACRICTNKVKAEWRKNNRERVCSQKRASYEKHREHYLAYMRSSERRHNWFRWKLIRQFGITLEQFETMMENQAGCCAICGKSPEEAYGHSHKHRLSVDHCHKTGKVRGLLCNNCNTGLGAFRDNPSWLKRAIKYLIFNANLGGENAKS